MAFAWQQRATVSWGAGLSGVPWPRVATLRQDFKLGAPTPPQGKRPGCLPLGLGGSYTAVEPGRGRNTQPQKERPLSALVSYPQWPSHIAGVGRPCVNTLPQA